MGTVMFWIFPITLLCCGGLLRLPALITGDWHHDRCERIIRGEFL